MGKDTNQLWKDYVDKGYSFVNWFTSILISNFVYLVNLAERKSISGWGQSSVFLSLVALVFIFLFHGIGIFAARKRHDLESQNHNSDEDISLKRAEGFRDFALLAWGALGIVAVFISGFILWNDLTE